MKTTRYISIIIGFFSGIVSAVSLMGLYAFSGAPGSAGSPAGIIPVSAAVANAYYKNYMAGAVNFNQVIKGFTLDKNQLDAMNNIARENAALTKFRIYMGKDNNGKQIAIVVGVDGRGLDAVSNTIYNTDAPGNPCPPVCDADSPISKD